MCQLFKKKKQRMSVLTYLPFLSDLFYLFNVVLLKLFFLFIFLNVPSSDFSHFFVKEENDVKKKKVLVNHMTIRFK